MHHVPEDLNLQLRDEEKEQSINAFSEDVFAVRIIRNM